MAIPAVFYAIDAVGIDRRYRIAVLDHGRAMGPKTQTSPIDIGAASMLAWDLTWARRLGITASQELLHERRSGFMIITEKELQRRLESTKNLANQPFVPNVLPVAYKQLPIQPFQIPNDSVRLPQERPKLPLETQKVIAG